jgi:hypothetical protein
MIKAQTNENCRFDNNNEEIMKLIAEAKTRNAFICTQKEDQNNFVA